LDTSLNWPDLVLSYILGLKFAEIGHDFTCIIIIIDETTWP
jgi:hypothetical protein